MTPPPKAASPENLTFALRRCGAISDGSVRDVSVESDRSTVLSRITRLSLTYERPAGDAPRTVIFKTGLPERLNKAWSGGRREVAFYKQVASEMPAGVVPQCIDAEWEADTGDWSLVLEDLTDSHLIATTWPLPPTLSTAAGTGLGP